MTWGTYQRSSGASSATGSGIFVSLPIWVFKCLHRHDINNVSGVAQIVETVINSDILLVHRICLPCCCDIRIYWLYQSYSNIPCRTINRPSGGMFGICSRENLILLMLSVLIIWQMAPSLKKLPKPTFDLNNWYISVICS